MGQILGILGELIPLLGGIYIVVYFGGYRTPKYKNEAQKESFEKLRSKHGKKVFYLGIFLILYGAYGITRMILK